MTSALPATVWMSVYRAGMPHHRLVPGTGGVGVSTACGRFITDGQVVHGVLLHGDVAEAKGGRCDRCWPAPGGEPERAGAAGP